MDGRSYCSVHVDPWPLPVEDANPSNNLTARINCSGKHPVAWRRSARSLLWGPADKPTAHGIFCPPNAISILLRTIFSTSLFNSMDLPPAAREKVLATVGMLHFPVTAFPQLINLTLFITQSITQSLCYRYSSSLLFSCHTCYIYYTPVSYLPHHWPGLFHLNTDPPSRASTISEQYFFLKDRNTLETTTPPCCAIVKLIISH